MYVDNQFSILSLNTYPRENTMVALSLYRLALLASVVSGSITHQNPVQNDHEALSKYQFLRASENDPTNNTAKLSTRGFSAVTTTQLFGRAEPGEGALLCPDGECPDKRYVN